MFRVLCGEWAPVLIQSAQPCMGLGSRSTMKIRKSVMLSRLVIHVLALHAFLPPYTSPIHFLLQDKTFRHKSKFFSWPPHHTTTTLSAVPWITPCPPPFRYAAHLKTFIKTNISSLLLHQSVLKHSTAMRCNPCWDLQETLPTTQWACICNCPHHVLRQEIIHLKFMMCNPYCQFA